ncbi:VOC family protein [Herbiconiux sp. P15]|uniref:VOC family protein n=1 Tax=Herbiconiux liukaitaii TaxID=3342799 RepID=UPI0035B8B999
MLRGLSTVSFWAADLEAAETWYSELLGVEAYFHVPGYVEFRVGDFAHELGIIDARYAPPTRADGLGGEIVYWHVDDVEASLERLLARGASLHEAPRDRSEGFITASVVDPFGNILGIMYNPHYLEVLAAHPALGEAPGPA